MQRRGERCVNILAGCIVALLGLAMVFAPGPGSLVLAIGLAFLGAEFEAIARFMTRGSSGEAVPVGSGFNPSGTGMGRTTVLLSRLPSGPKVEGEATSSR
jgi:hypothetical protein